jgi:hypothetical protein
MKIKLEDRVFLGDRKGAFRVVGFGELHGEKAVALINNAEIGIYRDWLKFRETWDQHNPPGTYPFKIVRRVPVADLVRDHERRGWRERWRQQELDFSKPPPPPPSGPDAEPYKQEDGRPSAFLRFLETAEGAAFWESIQTAALEALEAGEKRFSPRSFLGNYRVTEKVRVNDHYSPWFADMLVKEYPDLLDIVERRERKKPGPFDIG